MGSRIITGFKKRMLAARRPVFWIGLLLGAALIVGFYAYEFGPSSGWRLSHDAEDWARFGEYAGGAFGALAFLGVLWTVGLQQVQVDQLTRQAAADQLQRIAADLSARIEERLDRRGKQFNPPTARALQERGLEPTMRGVLALVADAATTGRENEHASVLEAQHGPAISEDGAIVARNLDQLAACLRDYLDQGGSPAVVSYYAHQYSETVRRMIVLGCQITQRAWRVD
jgi:hypothetical protein